MSRKRKPTELEELTFWQLIKLLALCVFLIVLPYLAIPMAFVLGGNAIKYINNRRF